MSELFVKDRIIPEHILEDIRYDIPSINSFNSGVTSKNSNGSFDPNIRKSTERLLDPNMYPDLCDILENFCSRIDSKHISSNLKLEELHHLEYGIGGHFKKHNDVITRNHPRRFSTITLLFKSDDLEGGELMIYDDNEKIINTDLEVGETIIFYSSIFHIVTPITKGGREVLVGWIYDR